jgi:uncharacterized pyridoxal phosphate-containing UPF0001 family protein
LILGLCCDGVVVVVVMLRRQQQVLSVPNLDRVETVDSVKLATALDKAAAAVGRTTPLSILVQINTSGEESRSP